MLYNCVILVFIIKLLLCCIVQSALDSFGCCSQS